jgi:hypothetical protein
MIELDINNFIYISMPTKKKAKKAVKKVAKKKPVTKKVKKVAKRKSTAWIAVGGLSRG